MTALANVLRNNMRQYGMVIALVLIMLLFQFLTGGILLEPLNVTNLILQNSYILVLAIGMVLVIINGHIDLSVGSVAAFVGAVAAVLMVDLKMPLVLAFILSIILGALIGAWQGFWVAYVRVPSFIVTLAGMMIFRGLTMVVLEGKSVGPFPDAFRSISAGFTPDWFGGTNLHLFSIFIGIAMSLALVWFESRKRAKDIRYGINATPFWYYAAQLIIMVIALNLFIFVLASYKGIPIILIILFMLVVIYTFIANRTVMGRHVYAMGGNEKAAKLSGIKTKQVSFWVFVNMGALAALSGLIFAARLNAATPKAGVNFELDAIAASFIGGASMSGGVGTVVGSIVGGLVMGVMNNGMSIKGLGIDVQQVIKGLVLLLAVAFDVYNRNKSS